MRKKFSFFLLATVFLVAACGGGGGGGGSSSGGSGGGGDTDTGSGNITPDNGVAYTTPEGMPIFVDYRVGGQTPIFTLNLSGGNKMEIEINWTGTGIRWQENGGGWTTATTDGAPGSSIAFSDGYSLLYSGRGDSTITTPKGETLRFFVGVSNSELIYDSGAGTTFRGEVWANAPGNIWLTVNGVGYGPLGFTPGYISTNADTIQGINVGYSAEGGHQWGFDPQRTNYF